MGTPKRQNRKSNAYKKLRAAFLQKRMLWGGWWRCAACARMIREPHVDHIRRVGMGGSVSRLFDTNNWQILCNMCHYKKDSGWYFPR